MRTGYAPTPKTLKSFTKNWIAKKAIDIVPFDMLREWRSWQLKGDEITKVEAAEKSLGVRQKLMAGMIRGRLYGGGAIIIGDGAPDPAEELVIDNLPLGGIEYLNVQSCHTLTAGEIDRDPVSAYFGEPLYYDLAGRTTGSQRIHPSRVIRFLGSPLPDEETLDGSTWSDSILQGVLDAVDQATSANQHIAAMLPEAKQDIITVPGLSHALSSEEGTRRLTERFTYAARMKSMFGMLLLEGDGSSPEGELYQQKQLSFDGLPEVAQLFLMVAAAAADIPATRFLSQSPAGMNATGDSDTRNYYDAVSSRQEIELTPAIERLDRALLRHSLGAVPSGAWYEWNPLYQMSQTEKAEAGLKKAQAFKIDLESGLFPEAALAKARANQLTEDGVYPGFEVALAEAEAEAGSIDFNEPADAPANDNPVPPAEEALRAARATGRRMGDFVADAAPRTLYVSRKVLNGAPIIAWAKANGFETTLPADDLHVTIAYSRTPLDWMKVEADWNAEKDGKVTIPAGGPRMLDRFGDATVLAFASWALAHRHGQIRAAGASWDHDEFTPHVTLSYAGPTDIAAIAAYNGPIELGPEIFAEVQENWSENLKEV